MNAINGTAAKNRTTHVAESPIHAGEPAFPEDGTLISRLDNLVDRMGRIEAALDELLRQRTAKDWYSTAEVAKLLGKSDFTVREWCRLGRVHAKKRQCGRGQSQEWIIAHSELRRIQNEGLLPAKD